jgi:hypothetical protein
MKMLLWSILTIALTLGAIPADAQRNNPYSPNPPGSPGCGTASGGADYFYIENDSCSGGCGSAGVGCCHQQSGGSATGGSTGGWLQYCDDTCPGSCGDLLLTELKLPANLPAPISPRARESYRPAFYEAYAALDVRIAFDHYAMDAAGKYVLTKRSVRIEKNNGDWEETNYSLAGAVISTAWGLNGRGVFRVDTGRAELLYLGERPKGYIRHFDADAARTSAAYMGEGTIVDVAIIKIVESGPFETWSAPSLNGAVLYRSLGGKVAQASAAVQGHFTLDPTPALPIGNRVFEKQLHVVDRINPAMARQLRTAKARGSQ